MDMITSKLITVADVCSATRLGKTKIYELINEGDRTFVVIKELITSREWMTRLAQEFVIGKRFEIPESVAKYAAMIA